MTDTPVRERHHHVPALTRRMHLRSRVKDDQPDSSGSLGLPAATALVVGSVIGTGVFGLPAALASFGPISVVAFGQVTLGAVALALAYQSLNRRVPGSGGPYLYPREAFGDFAGFLNAWGYWMTAWAGNAAIVVVFSFWMLAGSGYQAAYYGMFGLMLGVPVYIWLKHGRGEYGEFPRADERPAS